MPLTPAQAIRLTPDEERIADAICRNIDDFIRGNFTGTGILWINDCDVFRGLQLSSNAKQRIMIVVKARYEIAGWNVERLLDQRDSSWGFSPKS